MNLLGRYFTEREKEFFSKRQAHLKQLDRLDIADSPFLFATRQSMADVIARYELYKRILHVSGHIVECGVNRGNSLIFYAHLSSVLEPFAINRKIVGFDTFEGFRSIDEKQDPKDISQSDFSRIGAFENLKTAIELYDMNRPAGHMRRVEVVKGDAVDTIERYVKAHPEMTIALLYLDFDIYEPTKRALELLFPLVCKGGMVVFDQFNYEKFSGETAAAKEVLNIGNTSLQRFPFAPFIAYFSKE